MWSVGSEGPATGRISDYFQASVQVRRRALLSVRMPAHGGISRLRLDPVWCARGDLRTSFDWLTDSAHRTFITSNFIPYSIDVHTEERSRVEANGRRIATSAWNDSTILSDVVGCMFFFLHFYYQTRQRMSGPSSPSSYYPINAPHLWLYYHCLSASVPSTFLI